MAATIKIKNSSTAGAAPTASDLVQGELAVNVTDKRLYTENSGGTIVELGTNPSVPVTFPDGSASAPSLTNSGDTNTGIFFPAADTIAFAEGGVEAMRLDSSGNMGLGTTSPLTRLHVQGANTTGKGQFIVSSASAGQEARMTFIDGPDDIAEISTDGNNLYFLNEQASGAFLWYTNGSERMRLDASGNLGVGTTSPSTRLHIYGDGAALRLQDDGNLYAQVSTDNSGNLYLAADVSSGADSSIRFLNDNTERARIDSSGNLLVGTTSTTPIASNIAGTLIKAAGGIQLMQTANTSDWGVKSTSGSICNFYSWNGSSAVLAGSISVNGNVTTYGSVSDYRLKDVTGVLTGYKERLLALQPKQGSWKVDGSEFRGFLAHEFAASYPTSVSGEKDAVDAEGNPQYQGMQAGGSEVIADLVAYIKELETRLSALEQA